VGARHPPPPRYLTRKPIHNTRTHGCRPTTSNLKVDTTYSQLDNTRGEGAGRVVSPRLIRLPEVAA
jgi:hypothetical protein